MYITIIYWQRNGYESESINTSMRQYLVEASYRDPSSLDPKTFKDITTVDDFWNWHEHVLIPRLLKETPDAPDWSQVEPYTLLQHNYLVGSFRMTLIRAQQRKCELKDKYQGFIDECTEELFLSGLLGKRDTADWTLKVMLSRDTHSRQALRGAYAYHSQAGH